MPAELVVDAPIPTPTPPTIWEREVSFDGAGYIDLNKKMISHKVDMNWELKINFSTWIQEGLILWQGNQIQENLFDDDDTSNYIALGIRNSRMLFISNGIELSVNQIVSDGQQHMVTVKKEGNQIKLHVNGAGWKSNVYTDMSDSGLMNQLQTLDFYLGGLPSTETIEGDLTIMHLKKMMIN